MGVKNICQNKGRQFACFSTGIWMMHPGTRSLIYIMTYAGT